MNERSKLLFITDKLTFGGTPLQMVELVTRLNQREFQPHFIALSEVDERLRARLKKHDIFVKQIGCSNWTRPAALPAMARLLRLILQTKPHILHAFLTTGNVLGAVLGKIARVPHIIASHRDLGGFDGKWITRASRWSDRYVADVITANSEAVKQAALRRMPGAPKRWEVLYNGIDLAIFENRQNGVDRRSQLGVRPGDFVIAMVANLRPAKGHDIALQAFAQLTEQMPQAKLLLFGAESDAEYSKKLRRLVAENGLGERVLFMGARDDIAEILPACDVLLAPSRSEGFSNTILEAMAAGLPVIASAVGGNLEQTINGETGFLIPADDSSALRAKILEINQQTDMRLAMGRAARERVRKYFHVDVMVERHERLYRSLLRSTSTTG